MDIILAIVSARKAGLNGSARDLVEEYVKRATRYFPCSVRVFPSEAKMMEFLASHSSRNSTAFIAADSQGSQMTSKEFATDLTARIDRGAQMIVIGVGPADGWSLGAIKRADQKIAFGRITLPHELAAVVAAEQIYRALTIRVGHPYHVGH
jgi:23S rRNA (pseudouridine1915-N3)-methyltransferase